MASISCSQGIDAYIFSFIIPQCFLSFGMQHLEFQSPFLQFNGQLQTLLPAIFRKPRTAPYSRERFILSDGDFVDLDWLQSQNDRLILVSHGLEGNSDRSYVKGIAKHFSSNNFDVLAWNCRSCSGTMNKAPRLYHHGEVEDISEVIKHVVKQHGYKEIWLSGFSMGANISLNYLGKKHLSVPTEVKGAVVCSAPLDLADGVDQLHTSEGAFHRKRFFQLLSKKIKIKAQQFPGLLDISKLDSSKHWTWFDRHFSAPLSGCKNELEFYEQATPLNFMHHIEKPVLIVNAKNDPLLGKKCYPEAAIKQFSNIEFEIPVNGGHVGFSERGSSVSLFERRALDWIEKNS